MTVAAVEESPRLAPHIVCRHEKRICCAASARRRSGGSAPPSTRPPRLPAGQEPRLEEPEYDLQSIVDRAQRRLRERAAPPAETRSIECADLVRENACRPAGDFDLGPKDGRQCTHRGGRHDDSRELLEKIRLD